jgi:hypothetical protein
LLMIMDTFEITINGASFIFTSWSIRWKRCISITCHNFCNLLPLDYCFKRIMNINQFKIHKKLIMLHFDQSHNFNMFPILLHGYPRLHFTWFWMLILNCNVNTHNTRPWNSPSNELIHVSNLNIMQICDNCKGKWNIYILKFNKNSPPNLSIRRQYWFGQRTLKEL